MTERIEGEGDTGGEVDPKERDCFAPLAMTGRIEGEGDTRGEVDKKEIASLRSQ